MYRVSRFTTGRVPRGAVRAKSAGMQAGVTRAEGGLKRDFSGKPRTRGLRGQASRRGVRSAVWAMCGARDGWSGARHPTTDWSGARHTVRSDERRS